MNDLPLNIATVERKVGPWHRSSHSFAEGDPPHKQRDQTRARLDPIWADADHLVLLAVNDYDGCYAVALSDTREPDSLDANYVIGRSIAEAVRRVSNRESFKYVHINWTALGAALVAEWPEIPR